MENVFKSIKTPKRQLIGVIIIFLCPFLQYLDNFIPHSITEITVFNTQFEPFGFYDWRIFSWYFLQELVPLIVYVILFLFIKNRLIAYALLPLISISCLQIISLFFIESQLVTNIFLDLWFVFPIILMSLVILVKIKYSLNKREYRNQKEEFKLKEKMISLKHRALNAQMNPHFINNLLLHIYVALEKGDQKNSLSNLGNFSQLVGLVLKSTKSDFISLEDELKITTYYLQLQQSRFEHKFKYLIQIDKLSEDDVEFIKVPPMILQPILENAIEHGIRPMDKIGKIQLTTYEEENYLRCVITDNGIGYSQSKGMQKKYSSGISMKNIEERLQIMNRGVSEEKLLTIEDHLNEYKEIIGTKVMLKIPLRE